VIFHRIVDPFVRYSDQQHGVIDRSVENDELFGPVVMVTRACMCIYIGYISILYPYRRTNTLEVNNTCIHFSTDSVKFSFKTCPAIEA